MSYKKLEIWKLARTVSIDIHAISINLPKFELYETKSLKSEEVYHQISEDLDVFGKNIY